MIGNAQANIYTSTLYHKGSCDGNGGFPNQNVQKGDCFHASSDFTVGGIVYQQGDILIAMKDNPGQNSNNWSRMPAMSSGSDRPISDKELVDSIIYKYNLNISSDDDIKFSLFNL